MRDQLIKAEVLLDRAHFSPGVIDGREGGNLQQALAAYQGAHGLKPGPLDAPHLERPRHGRQGPGHDPLCDLAR